MTQRRPWFSYYVDDFELDDKVATMTLEEEGAYHRLLRYQWRHVAVPTDIKRMAGICGVEPRRMTRLWRSLVACFPNGINPRLETERQKCEEIRQKRQASGSLGGKAKQASAKEVPPVSYDPCDSNTQVTSHIPQTTKTKELVALVLVSEKKPIPESQLATAIAEWLPLELAWDRMVDGAMRIVFSYWVAKTNRDANRTWLTSERKAHIRARLHESPKGDIAAATSPLLWAVDGVMSSSFHVEGGHTKLEQVFRNRSRLEGFAEKTGGYQRGELHPLVNGG